MKRRVPEQFSTGSDRTNAQKAWLNGYDAASREQAEEIERLKAELRQVDAVLARRPALDKPTRWENIEHACSTAGRMSDRVVHLEREVVALRAELEQAQKALEKSHRIGADWMDRAMAAEPRVEQAERALEQARTKALDEALSAVVQKKIPGDRSAAERNSGVQLACDAIRRLREEGSTP